MHSVLRVTFTLEAIINIVTGLIYIFAPEILVLGLLPAESHAAFTGSAESVVWGLFGGVIITQSVVLLYGVVVGGSAAKNAYWALGLGEVLCAPVMTRYVNTFGVWNFSSYSFVGALLVFLFGRLVVLLWCPHWFNEGSSAKRKTQ
jgi:hypothetical protein